MSERKPYKTDLSDEQWAQVEPVITAWKAAHPSVSGHQGRYEMREIVNALLYQGRTGCQWDEHQPRASESRVYWAMTAVILRRLTGATAPSWRTA
ncbi:hypothetical protein SUDANB105_07680 [Streptomyces sp. enrichment culture]